MFAPDGAVLGSGRYWTLTEEVTAYILFILEKRKILF